MAYFKIEDICISFDQVPKPVLKNVSLEVKEKEIVSIIGESGCGKSTLLKIAAGLIEQEQGDVFLNGGRVLRPSEHLIKGHKKIKLVEQYAELLPNHNVFENLTYKLRNFIDEYQHQKVEELLTLTNLKGFENRKPRDLSGGQRQRLAIACALADDPDVILFDEPFSHLDNANKIYLLTELRDIIKDTGITVIFVTHSGEEALTLSDRILVMKEGEIIEEGIPKELYSNPKYDYTASFFGFNNFIPGKELAKLYSDKSYNDSELWGIKAEGIQKCSPIKKGAVLANIVSEYYLGNSRILKIDLDGITESLFIQDFTRIGKSNEISIFINPKDFFPVTKK